MLVPPPILMRFGALQKPFEKGEYIFHDGDHAKYYYQILKGKVKVFSSNEEGKIFLQGIFADGDSFGEPPMLINERYPSSAQAMVRSHIFKISAEQFMKILDEYPDIKHRLFLLMTSRCYEKSMVTKEVINQKTEYRILSFLRDFKRKRGNPVEKILVPFTRQEMADFTGLRVETVIRALKLLCDSGVVDIRERKLYF